MAIVDVDRLNRFLGSPRWSDDQEEEAADLLDEVEDSLAARLNTKISPVAYSESAAVLRSGLVLTRYHVYTVERINDLASASDGTPPTGWLVQDHWLRMFPAPTSGIPGSLAFGLYNNVDLLNVDAVGVVNVSYHAGLGNVPAIRRALLRKAGAIFNNRHDETVSVRELDANEPPALAPEDWSDEEINDLSLFRIVRVTR